MRVKSQRGCGFYLTPRGPTTASNGRATWLGTTFAEEPNSSFNRPVDKFSDFEELRFPEVAKTDRKTITKSIGTWLGATLAEIPNSSFNRPVDKLSDLQKLTIATCSRNRRAREPGSQAVKAHFCNLYFSTFGDL